MLIKLENIKKWLYEDGAKASFKAYLDKIDDINKNIISQLEYFKNIK
jgi:hypothetical protein